ncbi:MAG: NUDIX domain-containing protein [Actinomycetota bacterium]|nr:NUDIX domain-containing protein [Actinomycetota bacterium]
MLLVQRTVPPGKGLWSLPGGFLDAGEDPRATAAREVLEETGLRVSVGRVLDVFYNGTGPGASIFLLYEAEYRGGEPVAGDDAGNAAFFPRADLPDLAFASTAAAVRGWMGG